MNKQEIMEDVRLQMNERRWIHTQGVMATSIELANRYGEDPERAELAALIHDVAKCWAVKDQSEYILTNQLDSSILQYDKELWHAEVGSHVAFAKYGVQDEQIRNAIRYHTSGRTNMTGLEKVVWLADYIEPGRDFPGVEEARKLAEKSLEEAILFGLNQTLSFLIERNKQIYPVTVEARNAMLQQIK